MEELDGRDIETSKRFDFVFCKVELIEFWQIGEALQTANLVPAQFQLL